MRYLLLALLLPLSLGAAPVPKTDAADWKAVIQQREFDLQAHGYSATRHQREVGTGYFDAVAQVISAGSASTLALAGSTEQAQFQA